MRTWSASFVVGSVIVAVAACSSSSSDGSPSSSIDAGVDGASAPLCPANLVIGEQVADDQFAAGSCTTESEVCTLSETLCPGNPATFLCECEDGQWTCAIASGSFDACTANDGGTTIEYDANYPLDDSGADDASTDDAATVDASDD